MVSSTTLLPNVLVVEVSIDGPACNSVTFTTYGLQYQKVCGRLLGYQVGHPNAFYGSPNSIEESYVDGVSITHGKNPRKHIWTYAIGLTEINDYPHDCPCNSPNPGPLPPLFVGSDYHCESGLYSAPWSTNGAMYADDVMWDGKRCDGDEGPCCNKTGLPWFCKELSQPTTDDLEVRFCANEDSDKENAAVEFMDLNQAPTNCLDKSGRPSAKWENGPGAIPFRRE